MVMCAWRLAVKLRWTTSPFLRSISIWLLCLSANLGRRNMKRLVVFDSIWCTNWMYQIDANCKMIQELARVSKSNHLPSLVVPSFATNSCSPTSFSLTLWSFSFRLVSMISSISCSQFTRVGRSTLLSVSSFRLMLIGLLALNEFRSLYCWLGWRVLNCGGWLLFVNEVGNWCEFRVLARRDEIDLCDWFVCSFRPISLLLDSTRPLELHDGVERWWLVIINWI